jgi:hypothetical protein
VCDSDAVDGFLHDGWADFAAGWPCASREAT